MKLWPPTWKISTWRSAKPAEREVFDARSQSKNILTHKFEDHNPDPAGAGGRSSHSSYGGIWAAGMLLQQRKLCIESQIHSRSC